MTTGTGINGVNLEQLAALNEYVQKTSPVLDIIRNPVPVKVEIQG